MSPTDVLLVLSPLHSARGPDFARNVTSWSTKCKVIGSSLVRCQTSLLLLLIIMAISSSSSVWSEHRWQISMYGVCSLLEMLLVMRQVSEASQRSTDLTCIGVENSDVVYALC
ncbi:unnamed protein product [Heterobilharzia americana]|nr:unnamed protein product [Heterobilharzia americana]